MLTKLVSIKNTGRFRNSAGAGGNHQLARTTLLGGPNGFGKTTVVSVLRSLQTGDPAGLIGRKTLGSSEQQAVDLLVAGKLVRFDGARWNSTYPDIAIFDATFVAENVHSGETVALDQRRNLYRVIIGSAGVALTARHENIVALIKEKATAIAIEQKAIRQHLPNGMTLDVFSTLPCVTNIDERVEEQSRLVQSLEHEEAVTARPGLTEFKRLQVPRGLVQLLQKTLDDISQDAEDQVTKHLSHHGMSMADGAWVVRGADHTKESCALCGQDVTGRPLLAAYRAVFGSEYKSLRSQIEAVQAQIENEYGEAAAAKFEHTAATNKASLDFWEKYSNSSIKDVSIPADFTNTIRLFGQAAMKVLERKAARPLEPVEVPAALQDAMVRLEEACRHVDIANAAICDANKIISGIKLVTRQGNKQESQNQLAHLQATKTRYSGSVNALCLSHAGFTKEKNDLEAQRQQIRAMLDSHTQDVVKPYQDRINHYLDRFNGNFQLTETRHSYSGSVATSQYQIVVNGVSVDLGDSRTPLDRPSFRNTLSGGDKTTLALAFFLVNLENDLALKDKVVVFDDPFNSQDSFRRRQTVHAIERIANKCKQVIVLSHDPTFLKQVWERSPHDARVSMHITDHREAGCKIAPVDLEKLCQGRSATELDDLVAFQTSGAGALLDIIKKARIVLETYFRATYPSHFGPKDYLGEIAKKIRIAGDEHPAWALYEDVDEINSYTSSYHHGESAGDSTPDAIEPTELAGYVHRALKMVNM